MKINDILFITKASQTEWEREKIILNFLLICYAYLLLFSWNDVDVVWGNGNGQKQKSSWSGFKSNGGFGVCWEMVEDFLSRWMLKNDENAINSYIAREKRYSLLWGYEEKMFMSFMQNA